MITDEEIQKIFDWADNNELNGKKIKKTKYDWGINISTEEFNKNKFSKIRNGIPRDKNLLLSLTHINLQQKQLKDIPKELFKLKNLTHLNISKNDLSIFANEIDWLTNLLYLDISNNHLETIINIHKFQKLKYLNINHNWIWEDIDDEWISKPLSIPIEIGQLKNLIYLNLNNTIVKEIPKEIGNLSKLKYLYLHRTGLNSLPKEIGNLVELIELDFSKNNIKKIPKEINNLTKLVKLDFSKNNIETIPNELSNLLNLEKLNGEPNIRIYNNKNIQIANINLSHKQLFSNHKIGNLIFTHKNLLLKGVPGTGKSRAIENIINNKLNLQNHKENILRINIHSASSNADLMQGIGISSKDGQIEYKEKQGLILNLIQKATFKPHQPFVLILEEIQENSLNELIGDLIYLIEEDKRAKNIVADNKEYNYQELVEEIIKANPQTSYVEIPYLVNDSTEYRKMIMPDNLYIFCTSNYRDDKKVIEDNLLRRFEVLEIYPKDSVVHEYCREFFSQLNKNILEVMKDEIHPDRFLIGHSNWLNVDDEEKFYRAFLKVVVEFKDIKEVEFSDFKEIVEKLPLVEELELSSYKALIEDLQTKAGYDFLD